MENRAEKETKVYCLAYPLKDAVLAVYTPDLATKSPTKEGFREALIPVDVDEGVVQQTKKILEEFGCQECEICGGHIRYKNLPKKWVVPVQVIRTLIPVGLATRTGLERKLNETGIACTSKERRIIFTRRK